MGLDIYLWEGPEHQFRAGSYGGFHEFRVLLAESVGINLSKMQGFGGSGDWDGEPFEELLFHSDCDGYLYRWDCEELSQDFEDMYHDIIEYVKEFYPEHLDWFMTDITRWRGLIDQVAATDGIIEFA